PRPAVAAPPRASQAQCHGPNVRGPFDWSICLAHGVPLCREQARAATTVIASCASLLRSHRRVRDPWRGLRQSSSTWPWLASFSNDGKAADRKAKVGKCEANTRDRRCAKTTAA